MSTGTTLMANSCTELIAEINHQLPRIRQLEHRLPRTDQLRMLDQDMLRLQEKVNTVLEYRERQEILQDAKEKEALRGIKK